MFDSIVYPYFNFFVFLALFVYVFKKPLSNLAKQKFLNYQSYLNKSKEIRKNLEIKNKEIKNRLDDLDNHLNKLKKDGYKKIDLISNSITQNAKDEAVKIKSEIEKKIDIKIANSINELKKEILISSKDMVIKHVKENQKNEKLMDKLDLLNKYI